MKVVYPFSVSWQDYPSQDNAVVVYTLGCEHNCKNCHNKEFQNYNYSCEQSKDIIIDLNDQDYDYYDFWFALERECNKQHTNKIVFEGGDPLFIDNRNFIKSLLNINFSNKKFDICIYTGYLINEVMDMGIYGAQFYKCGKYIEELKDNSMGKVNNQLIFASKNQKLYDSNFNQISIDNYYTFKGENE